MGRAFEYRKARKLKRWGNMARTFTKLGKEIEIAVKAGGPDPAGNSHLRLLIQNARAENMPKENVERAIKRATSKDTSDYKEMVYEGYAPFGIAMVIETATDNPTKSPSAGGPVGVEAARVGSSFQVVVSDTGCGISAEDLPKVKTKFYKANFTRRGSGIGLAVANEIVQQHNGSLELASQVGKGTVVTITLPIQGES